MNRVEKLTTDYYKILSELYDNLTTVNGVKFAPITQLEISNKLNINKVTINRIFKELKEDGLVMQCPGNGRYSLSEEALKIVENIKKLNNYKSK